MTPRIGPQGQSIAGASVLPNCHIPTPKVVAAATPAMDNIRIFVDGMIPGTINIVVVESKKKSVETEPKIQ